SGKEDKELVDEVTFLAKKYGIVTPYTSYLMAEDIVHTAPGAPGGGPPVAFLTKLRAAGAGGQAMAEAPARKQAELVRNGKDQNFARYNAGKGFAGGFYEQADAALAREGRKGSSLQQMRYVASRTFYNSNNTWYEGTYEPAKHEKQVQRVKLRSKEY